MSRARVSGLMSVYNGAAYLAEAIDSMLAELGPDDEVIVVDDGSTDDTPEVLASYAGRITVLRQDNAGAAAALNRALDHAAGEYIAINDADDLWEPGRIGLQRQALDGDPDLNLVFGMSLQFVSPELSDELKRQYAPPVEVLRGEILPCAMLRASALTRIGRFDETMRVTFGYSWLARAKAEGLKFLMLDQIVARRRLHPNNWSRTHRAELNADALRAMREQILRRRAQPDEGAS